MHERPSLRDQHDERRPPLAFRIGVTGTRTIASAPAASPVAVHAAIARVLDAAIAAMVTARQSSRAVRCYDPDTAPLLRCVSPLAEGADQLFARLALEHQPNARKQGVDLCLEVVIPFAEADYLETFGKDAVEKPTQTYHELAQKADCGLLELDGSASDDATRPLSYEAAGCTVVRNADLLIALWDDGVAPKGRGGTRDIVQFALKTGVPVWWIDPTGKNSPRFLQDEVDLYGRDLADPPPKRLAWYLDSVLIPPAPVSQPGWLASRQPDALLDYLAEPLIMNRNCWLLHAGTMGNLRKAARKHDRAPAETAAKKRNRNLTRALLAPMGRGAYDTSRLASAQLSSAYQHRYRTSYFVVLALAAVALICAVLGVAGLAPESVTSPVELVALVGIATLVVASSVGRWHEKYINYRLLSELARPARLLNALGWSLPYAQMRRAAGYEGQGWIAWLAAAHARSMPMARGVARTQVGDLRDRIVGELVEKQIEFHENRHRECEGLAWWLSGCGLVTFSLTLLLVGAKTLMEIEQADRLIGLMLGGADIEEVRHWISTLTALGPALSAMFFGLRAYEELEPLSQLSAQLLAEFRDAHARIVAIDLKRPLASQMLAEELLKFSSAMLSEASGWAELFRSKAVEA